MVAVAPHSMNGSAIAEARFETPRTPGRKTFGHRVVSVAEKLGQPFMPWQQHWALVAGELIRDEETGLWVPAYPEAFATVMRQQGKTHWMFSHELDRALLWVPYDGKPQAIAHSGQNGLMARQKFTKELWPNMRRSELRSAVLKPRFRAEDTGISFKTGADWTIWATSEKAGHSLAIDLNGQDEIWADADDRRDQAAVPAMATRHDSQTIISSTGGTDESIVYLRKQAVGRQAVMDDRREGMAYLEFSADDKAADFDPESPKLWREVMPALGYTITERTVRNALETMRKEHGDLAEFCRAWLNITKRTGGDTLIPKAVWAQVVDVNAVPTGSLVIAADASPDQSAASIGVADTNGNCEVAVHGADTGWLLDKTTEMARRLKAQVAIDKSGPVGHLAAQLKYRSVKVVEFSPQDVAHACAEVYARIGEQPPNRIRVRPVYCDHCGQVPVNQAVEGASRQTRGDGWKWSRKTLDADISPLMAITLALGVQAGLGGTKPPMRPMVAVTR